MKTVELPDGPAERAVPALGQGTWNMGETKRAHSDEVAALRLGIDLGMTLIDTAEMYGEGGAEKMVADAIDGERERVFVVTKVYPHNASRTKLPKACERSLKRLRVDAIDLYLLHWRGSVPLAEIALGWVLRQPGVIAIPKASSEKHVRDNARSIDIELTKEDLADLDRAFPPPKSKQPLPML